MGLRPSPLPAPPPISRAWAGLVKAILSSYSGVAAVGSTNLDFDMAAGSGRTYVLELILGPAQRLGQPQIYALIEGTQPVHG